MVKDLLENLGLQTDLMPLITTGDEMQKSRLSDIKLQENQGQSHWSTGKGLFIKEIQQALLSQQAHVAVHSMKDLPVEQTEGLTVAALLPRASANDVLILSPNVIQETHPQTLNYEQLKSTLMKSPAFQSGVIGTTSGRRQFLVKRHFGSSLDVQVLRGNVDSRLKKIRNNEFSGILLALAGLERLHLEKADDLFVLPVSEFIPAAAQGVIAIEVSSEHKELLEKVKSLTSSETCIQAGLERLVLKILGGDCKSPVGAHFISDKNVLSCIWEKNHTTKEVQIAFHADDMLEIESLFQDSDQIYSVFFESLCHHPIAEKIKENL